MKKWIPSILLICVVPLLGCQPDPTPVSTELQFSAMVGKEAFDCTKEYKGMGTDKGTLKPLDLRMYIHNIQLVRADNGEKVPFKLDDVEGFQAKGVALLDFENGAGNCQNGTPELYTTLKGKAPRYTYKAIQFTLGVPKDINHTDLTAAPAPLNLTTMSWTWKAGRIFMSAMGQNDQGIHLVHIGSAGCTGDPETGDSVKCMKPFRPEYTLNTFDPQKNKIVIDWGAIFSGNAVGKDVKGCRQKKGPKRCGCHSRGPSELCSPPFSKFGISWETGQSKSTTQAVFRVAPLP